MQFLMSLLILIACAVILGVVTLLVAVDMAGKIDYLKTNLPSLVRWAERREWHGFLLLVCFGLLAVDAYELFAREMPDVGPPKVTFQFSGMAAKDAEIANLRGKLEARTPAESPNSLRRRTVGLVNELNRFWNHRPAPLQPIQNPVTDDERKRNATWDKYWRDAEVDYANANFRDRVLGIIREYKAKGIPTGNMEQGFEQPNRLAGAYTFGGVALEDCFDTASYCPLVHEVFANRLG